MHSLTGKYSLWEIWQDFIIMSAISIANVFDGPYRKQREKMYLDRAYRYTNDEIKSFAQMLSEIVTELERCPEQDLLGELFVSLGLSNEWRGQFFTPYHICRMMASMTLGQTAEQIEQQGWISVNDPACGAGALLVAYANECMRNKINYQTSVLFVAQDIDLLAGCMCYIQLSLLGCPGYVVVDDTILSPSISHDKRGLIPVDGSNVWYTPMYFSPVWGWRKAIAQMEILGTNKDVE